MKKNNFYTQCTLKLNNIYQISWIPSQFAIIGKILKLKNDGGEWIDGWEVIKIGQPKPSSRVEERERDHREFAEVLK